jgi:predicted dehydrogenase
LGAAISGCGLIGPKRAAALASRTIKVCCDVSCERAAQLAAVTPGAAPSTDWQSAVCRDDFDVVFVATPHARLAPIAAAAAVAGKHVLIEKPGALGEMMFIRGRYGHGGRPGYDREWRADPAISGGELIDMGPPETLDWEYPKADDSWQVENTVFLEDIRLGRQPDPGIADAQAALRVIEAVDWESDNRESHT